MFIRVTPYSFDPNKEQEVLRISHERLVPALRQLPGFRGYTGASDRTTGRGVASRGSQERPTTGEPAGIHPASRNHANPSE
jgi:hypothetical protein